MSLRLEMLQVARLAPQVLGEEASSLVAKFVLSHQKSDGGFSDRDGDSDLYYTSFAIDALTALSVELPEASLQTYLAQKLVEQDDLDFVHLCCLVRSASALTGDYRFSEREIDELLEKIEKYRTPDGGYNQAPNLKTGSTYASFLAVGAYQDHRRDLIEPEQIYQSLETLRQENGSWANDTLIPVGNVPATAAAVTLYRNLQKAIPKETGEFLIDTSFHPISGGILPFPGAPLPDLLSTAVALHALDGLQIDFSVKTDSMLDFIDSLWTNAGGFHGSWEDDDLDIEYTYYGLLALGHLSI